MSLASMSCEAPEPQGPASDLGEEETTLESVPDALLGRVFAQITDKCAVHGWALQSRGGGGGGGGTGRSPSRHIPSISRSLRPLPLPALCRITLSSLSLVCKRFRRVLYSDAPEQWHTLRLETSRLDFLTARAAVTPQTPPTCRHADPPASPTGRQQRQRWFAGKRRLLERVGGQVAALAVHDRTGMLRSSGHGAGGGWDLAALLGLLRPGVLADMELEVHPAPPLAALEMLPLFAGSLTALNLDAPQMPATVAALLPALCGLRHLRLAGQHLPEGAVGAAAGLDALTRLELESGFLPLPPLAPLTRLRRLRRLRVMDESQREEPLQVPPPSAWPAGLEALTLFMCSLCQVGRCASAGKRSQPAADGGALLGVFVAFTA